MQPLLYKTRLKQNTAIESLLSDDKAHKHVPITRPQARHASALRTSTMPHWRRKWPRHPLVSGMTDTTPARHLRSKCSAAKTHRARSILRRYRFSDNSHTAAPLRTPVSCRGRSGKSPALKLDVHLTIHPPVAPCCSQTDR